MLCEWCDDMILWYVHACVHQSSCDFTFSLRERVTWLWHINNRHYTIPKQISSGKKQSTVKLTDSLLQSYEKVVILSVSRISKKMDFPKIFGKEFGFALVVGTSRYILMVVPKSEGSVPLFRSVCSWTIAVIRATFTLFRCCVRISILQWCSHNLGSEQCLKLTFVAFSS